MSPDRRRNMTPEERAIAYGESLLPIIDPDALDKDISEIVDNARRAASGAAYVKDDGKRMALAEINAFWLSVLQARTSIDTAESQRRQTRWLVLGTWALVIATIGLVVVAIFFGPEIVVEVPTP